jgi:hypothetical protein
LVVDYHASLFLQSRNNGWKSFRRLETAWVSSLKRFLSKKKKIAIFLLKRAFVVVVVAVAVVVVIVVAVVVVVETDVHLKVLNWSGVVCKLLQVKRLNGI